MVKPFAISNRKTGASMKQTAWVMVGLSLAVLLAGCGEETPPEPSAVEAAGKELGQAVSRDLKDELEQAQAVQQQAQQAAEQLDKQIDEQTESP